MKRIEGALAREAGQRPLPATTLWRRIVALERAGYVRREVRPGGAGGTLSVVRLLTPIDEWVTAPGPWGTPRAFARPDAPSPAWPAGPEARPAPAGSPAIVPAVG